MSRIQILSLGGTPTPQLRYQVLQKRDWKKILAFVLKTTLQERSFLVSGVAWKYTWVLLVPLSSHKVKHILSVNIVAGTKTQNILVNSLAISNVRMVRAIRLIVTLPCQTSIYNAYWTFEVNKVNNWNKTTRNVLKNIFWRKYNLNWSITYMSLPKPAIWNRVYCQLPQFPVSDCTIQYLHTSRYFLWSLLQP